jgi:2,5-diamino-6-(ribosylamino)-4(3H)-pyrimidinone 5'-phosphate reductase
MTIDGKIASKDGDPNISNEDDWKHVHKLRTEVDAIMVGKGSIIKDNPKLHIKYYDHNGYYRVVLDSNLSIPVESNVVTYEPETYPTIIVTTENAPINKIKIFKSKNVEIIQSGKGRRVDVVKMMPILYDKGIEKILLEGGGNLNWSFIKNDLIDEIRITIGPWMVGGKDAVSLVEGEGYAKMYESPKFYLSDVSRNRNYLTLNYKKEEQ